MCFFVCFLFFLFVVVWSAVVAASSWSVHAYLDTFDLVGFGLGLVTMVCYLAVVSHGLLFNCRLSWFVH